MRDGLLSRVGASSLNSRKLTWTRLKLTNFYDICMSDLRRTIKFPTMDVNLVNQARYESHELGMSGDDMCTTCIYQRAITIF